MYAKYNGALRFYTGEIRYTAQEAATMKQCPPFLQQQCEHDFKLGKWTKEPDGTLVWEWHNQYATSIHATNSLVLKTSKLSVATPVYRGMANAALPKEFFEPNEDGVSGGVEYGFSSTTTDRAVAGRMKKLVTA